MLLREVTPYGATRSYALWCYAKLRLMVLREVTPYGATRSYALRNIENVCVFVSVRLSRVSTERLLRHVLLQVDAVPREWFCTHVITYINNTTTTLHIIYGILPYSLLRAPRYYGHFDSDPWVTVIPRFHCI